MALKIVRNITTETHGQKESLTQAASACQNSLTFPPVDPALTIIPGQRAMTH